MAGILPNESAKYKIRAPIRFNEFCAFVEEFIAPTGKIAVKQLIKLTADDIAPIHQEYPADKFKSYFLQPGEVILGGKCKNAIVVELPVSNWCHFIFIPFSFISIDRE